MQQQRSYAEQEPDCPDSESHQTLLSSINFISARPDVLQIRELPCSCGRVLKMGEDWYAEIYDGTLVCWQCTACQRCGQDCSTANRKMVSIGGHVLCYRCVKFYGKPRKDEFRASIVSNLMAGKHGKKRSRKLSKGGQVEPQAGHNLGYAANWWQSMYSPECRRLIRYRAYSKPENYIPSLDPKLKTLTFYKATRTLFDSMACPSCKSTAEGRSAYIVPSISMVYHRSCFRCAACKSVMSNGIRMAGRHFVFCTCNPPLVWCTRLDCAKNRTEHHIAHKCQLEPVHPGGRPQMDTRIVLNGGTEQAHACQEEPEVGAHAGAATGADPGRAPAQQTQQPTQPGCQQQASKQPPPPPQRQLNPTPQHTQTKDGKVK